VASVGISNVSVIAEQCLSNGASWTRSPIWIQCAGSPNNGGQGSVATVLQQVDLANNGPPTGSKGRLIFGGNTVHTYPNDLFTLQDSNYVKTLTANGERPLADAGDMALGLDQAGGLTQRAAISISSYINAIPSGTNFLERLTAAGKTFNVPVTVNGTLVVSGGTVTLPVTGTGAQCLHVSATGVLSGTGADCGSGGGGGGSGTVNSGSTSQVAVYAGSGTAVSGDSALTDNGTTLNYSGSGGVTASSGTFSGNLTVNGQLLVAGPWMVSSPIPATAMGAAGTGSSSLGISNDGNFYISASGGTPNRVATMNVVPAASSTTPVMDGTGAPGTATTFARADHVHPTDTSRAAAADLATETARAEAAEALLAPKGSAAFTGTPTAPTAATNTNSTQIATTAYVDGNYISPVLDWGKGYSSSTTVAFNTTTGHMQVFGIYIDRPVKCSSITVYVVGADNSANTYDIGLYYGVSGSSNNLIAHTGAVAGSAYFATASTYATIPFGTTVTLMPGRYYLGLYANEASAPATVASNSLLDMEFYHNSSVAITPASGGLPATFTGPTDQMTASATPHFLLK
jgi:hypothetical protein